MNAIAAETVTKSHVFWHCLNMLKAETPQRSGNVFSDRFITFSKSGCSGLETKRCPE